MRGQFTQGATRIRANCVDDYVVSMPWFRRRPNVPWTPEPVHLFVDGAECGARLWTGDENTPVMERQAVGEYRVYIWGVTCQECRIAFRLRGWDGHVHACVGVEAGRPYCGAAPSEVSLLPPETVPPDGLGHRITCPRCLEDLDGAIAQSREDASERYRLNRERWAKQDRERGRSD